MSNQMSTSINNLPTDTSNAPPVNTDPSVTDVLAEMEREVAAAQRPSPQQRPPQSQQPTQQSYLQTQMSAPQPYGNQQMPMLLPPYMKEPSREWVDMSKLQTAVVASVIAVLLLIPNVSFIYERVQRLAPFQSYELFIRVGLLALVLYIAMVKLTI